MLNQFDYENRKFALRLAIRSAGSNALPQEIVARAKEFEVYLSADSDSTGTGDKS